MGGERNEFFLIQERMSSVRHSRPTSLELIGAPAVLDAHGMAPLLGYTMLGDSSNYINIFIGKSYFNVMKLLMQSHFNV